MSGAPQPVVGRAERLVVKLGGEVIADAATLRRVCGDIANLCADRHRVFVVHGGGPQATALQKALGLEPRIVGGRRITDAATLQVVTQSVAGGVNVELVAALCAAGLRAVGLSGVSAGLVRAHRRPPVVVTGAGAEPIDLGWVGDVESINTELLTLLSSDGYLPVVSCLGGDARGGVYNINADIVAGEVASALHADRLLHLTGAPGVLADAGDPSTRFPVLTASAARAAILAGQIKGGMIPKVEESLARLDGRIGAIHILSAQTEGGLRAEVSDPGSVGTVLMAEARA